MSDDLLAQMTGALKEEYDGATAVPEATRARVVRTLAERRPRRKKWFVVGIPLFALLGGSTAWAAAGGHLPELVERAVAVFVSPERSEEQEVVQKTPGPLLARKSPAVDAPSPDAPDEASEEITEPVSGEESEPDLASSSATPSPHFKKEKPEPSSAMPMAKTGQAEVESSAEVRKAAPTPEPKEVPVSFLAVYRAAHRAHFQDGNCISAVAGYEQYLEKDPQGSFALEAKYNRALCLAKLGRNADAIAALQPFAAGSFGNYRLERAKALIEALSK